MEYSISACFSLHHMRLWKCLIERLVKCTKMKAVLLCDVRVGLSEVVQEESELPLQL